MYILWFVVDVIISKVHSMFLSFYTTFELLWLKLLRCQMSGSKKLTHPQSVVLGSRACGSTNYVYTLEVHGCSSNITGPS